MAKKVTIENFAAEVEKILKEYEGEVSENLDTITKKIGQKGVQMLKNKTKATFPVPNQKSKRKSTGKYARGWTSKAEWGRLYTTVTIYNRTPGMPHLLENGHAIVSGGRVSGEFKGAKHIAPVEKELIEDYEKEIVAKL